MEYAGRAKRRRRFEFASRSIHPKRCRAALAPALQRGSHYPSASGLAVEFEFFKVEIGIRNVNLHLVDFTLRVESKGDKAPGKRIDDCVTPLDAESVKVPVLQVANEVGRRQKTHYQFALLFSHFGVAKHLA